MIVFGKLLADRMVQVIFLSSSGKHSNELWHEVEGDGVSG